MGEFINSTAKVIFKNVKEDLEAKDPEDVIIKRIEDILEAFVDYKKK